MRIWKPLDMQTQVSGGFNGLIERGKSGGVFPSNRSDGSNILCFHWPHDWLWAWRFDGIALLQQHYAMGFLLEDKLETVREPNMILLWVFKSPNFFAIGIWSHFTHCNNLYFPMFSKLANIFLLKNTKVISYYLESKLLKRFQFD